jgi:hypothetical protein
MRVVTAAHEAPALHLVDHLDLALGVPRLWGDVHPVDLEKVLFVAPTGIAPPAR